LYFVPAGVTYRDKKVVGALCVFVRRFTESKGNSIFSVFASVDNTAR
jgi:hypothetical protein